MDLPYYPVQLGPSHLVYTFTSLGQRGKIRKAIKFNLAQTQPIVVYNVALGDVAGVDEINTHVISDNGDRDKILRTVATVIIMFCHRHPQAFVGARGNSPARNRLYQMIISNRMDEIRNWCEIYGVKGSQVVTFRKNQNYDGFLAKALKNSNFKRVP